MREHVSAAVREALAAKYDFGVCTRYTSQRVALVFHCRALASVSVADGVAVLVSELVGAADGLTDAVPDGVSVPLALPVLEDVCAGRVTRW